MQERVRLVLGRKTPITSLCQTASLEGTCGSDRNAVLLGSNSAFATQGLLEGDAGHYTTTHERVLHTSPPKLQTSLPLFIPVYSVLGG